MSKERESNSQAYESKCLVIKILDGPHRDNVGAQRGILEDTSLAVYHPSFTL